MEEAAGEGEVRTLTTRICSLWFICLHTEIVEIFHTVRSAVVIPAREIIVHLVFSLMSLTRRICQSCLLVPGVTLASQQTKHILPASYLACLLVPPNQRKSFGPRFVDCCQSHQISVSESSSREKWWEIKLFSAPRITELQPL